MKSPLEETGSWKYSDFSLAEVWHSPTGCTVLARGGNVVSFPVGNVRYISSSWAQ